MKNPFFKTGLMALVLVAFSVTTFAEVSGYGGGGTRVRKAAPTGEVLGESTVASSTAGTSTACAGMYLSDYMRKGMANNPEQVTKLQTFLSQSKVCLHSLLLVTLETSLSLQ